jgi:hypothetical protein
LITGDLVSRACAALLVERDPFGCDGAGGAPVDAIVVPAARPVDGLQEAIGLAADTGAFLVVVCSHAAAPRAAAAALSRAGCERGMVVDLTRAWGHPLLDLSTSRVPSWRWPQRDLDVKRNIGLLLARLAGWRRLFFLDDDLRGVRAARLRRAGALLSRHAAVGLRTTEFPDNSVVRHAERLAGGDPGVFISGGALAVDCWAADAFFPGIYGEDWFFLLPLLADGRVATLGTVTQSPCDPFDPVRAAREELGDLLAEGMLELLLASGSIEPPAEAHWARAIVARDRFLRDVLRRLPATREGVRAEASLHAARARLSAISPASCAGFVNAWRADLRVWAQRVAGLPAGLSPAEAAAWLGLPVLTPTRELVIRCP